MARAIPWRVSLKINSEMRRANNKVLSDLRLKYRTQVLMVAAFRTASSSFPGGSQLCGHAELHLQRDQVSISRCTWGMISRLRSMLVWRRPMTGGSYMRLPLGIYGNCIVVDHGYGLQTIYGHLSQIAVHEGDLVKRGQVMGTSGRTGMAGGDHIHFAMQLDGVQIDPKEWWDSHWIKDHIAKRVDLPGFK